MYGNTKKYTLNCGKWAKVLACQASGVQTRTEDYEIRSVLRA